MPNKPRKQAQEQEDEESSGPDERTQVTVAKGGMSPLADRKDTNGWQKSVDAAPATEKSGAPAGGSPPPTPSEPVGGWVDASTGRGKIMVPKTREAMAKAHESRDERSPMRLVKAKDESAIAALPSAESLAGRLRDQEARERKEKAAAEAGARERQGENRNEQDAVREDEEDEQDEESDENQ